jgi:hypothetical protein
MALATVPIKKNGSTDQLFADVVAKLSADGIKILGALRTLGHSSDRGRCNSDLCLLPNGPVVKITQKLGAGSTACRMDAGAFEEAVGLVTTRFATERADLIVVNKFGFREAEGHGFRMLIADAIELGVPVLIGIPGVYRNAFGQFAGEMATELPSEKDVIVNWYKQYRAELFLPNLMVSSEIPFSASVPNIDGRSETDNGLVRGASSWKRNKR